MDFGEAIRLMKTDAIVARKGWNGKGMYIGIYTPMDELMDCPFIYMYTAQGQNIPWLASQADMLAEDWAIIE